MMRRKRNDSTLVSCDENSTSPINDENDPKWFYPRDDKTTVLERLPLLKRKGKAVASWNSLACKKVLENDANYGGHITIKLSSLEEDDLLPEKSLMLRELFVSFVSSTGFSSWCRRVARSKLKTAVSYLRPFYFTAFGAHEKLMDDRVLADDHFVHLIITGKPDMKGVESAWYDQWNGEVQPVTAMSFVGGGDGGFVRLLATSLEQHSESLYKYSETDFDYRRNFYLATLLIGLAQAINCSVNACSYIWLEAPRRTMADFYSGRFFRQVKVKHVPIAFKSYMVFGDSQEDSSEELILLKLELGLPFYLKNDPLDDFRSIVRGSMFLFFGDERLSEIKANMKKKPVDPPWFVDLVSRDKRDVVVPDTVGDIPKNSSGKGFKRVTGCKRIIQRGYKAYH